MNKIEVAFTNSWGDTTEVVFTDRSSIDMLSEHYNAIVRFGGAVGQEANDEH